MNYHKIINKFYQKGTTLYNINYIHGLMVATLATEIANDIGLTPSQINFIYEASMIHDIGIFKTDAPSIECYGSEPYIRHGIVGETILSDLGYHKHARVCLRHTGCGLTKKQIQKQNLPLPLMDLIPETIEEQIICYADKYYGKSGDLTKRKSLDEIKSKTKKHGKDGEKRLLEWVIKFGDRSS